MWPSDTLNVLEQDSLYKNAWHDLVSAQNHAESMVAPLIVNVYITCHAALNAIYSMYVSNSV